MAQSDTSTFTTNGRFEVIVCKVGEIKNGEMRHVPVPGQNQQILFGKAYDGSYFAIGSACTHYNSFLKNGVLGVDRVRCAWHGACFNIKTGDIEEFPGVDSVHVFEVDTVGENLVVRGDAKNVDNQRKLCPMSKWNVDAKQETVVIIGAGPAGLLCAETLRKNRFEGRVTILTEELHPPYDRPKLSKALDSNIDKILLRKPEFLRDHDIELRTNTKVASVDLENRKLALAGANSESLQYDYLIIATGQKARRLPIETAGADWNNVYYIRTVEDANRLNEAGNGKRVVVLGSSFIGMEAAAYFVEKAQSVTVISKTRLPYQAAFGSEVGEALKTGLFDKKGVSFLASVEVERYKGDQESKTLKQVKLSDGSVLDLDVLLVGMGSEPNTEFLKDTKLALNPVSKALIVDEFMATNVSNVFGAGDCTEFPLLLYGGVRTTIGHWNIAHQQGKIAALNVLGKRMPLRTVPYFWTTIFSKSIRYAGFGHPFSDYFVHGSLNDSRFIVYYLRGDEVIAACSLMYDPVVSRYAELVSNGAKITRETIMEDPELIETAAKVFAVAL